MKHIAAVLGIAFAVSVAAASALGCECPTQKSLEEELAWSEVVFAGEAVRVTQGDRETSIMFKPQSVLKGIKSETLTLTSSSTSKACQFEFKSGSSYLVYATTKGSTLQTTRCTRTRPIEYASDDIDKLRGGSGWSPAVNGIRGRVSFLPAYTGESQYFRVILELENVSNTLGQRSIRFEPDRVDLEIMERGIERVPTAQSLYSGLKPVWKETLIPFRGSTKFDISFPGTALLRTDRPVIDLGSTKVWALDAKAFYAVTARLTIPRQKGDHPTIDWSGTLEMPTMVLRPFPPKVSTSQ